MWCTHLHLEWAGRRVREKLNFEISLQYGERKYLGLDEICGGKRSR